MLPYAEHTPAGATQCPCNAKITLPISANLLIPKSLIRLGAPVATRTSVPETAIDKNNQSLPPKNEIRTTDQSKMAPPSFDACSSHQRDECQLSPTIAATSDSRHHFGTLCSTADIRHIQNNKMWTKHLPSTMGIS